MAIEHDIITDPEIHEPKGVSTATAGQTYIADGAGSGVWTSGTDLNDVVEVNILTDFPTPSGGAITLVDNTNYVIGADISIGTDRLILGENNSITANNINGARLIYTGTGDMITGVNKFFDIHNITLTAATANQVFNISETGGGNLTITTMRTVGVSSCKKWGTFDQLNALDVSDSNSLAADDGVTIVGTGWLIVSFTKFALVSTSATFIGVDFGVSTHTNVELQNLVLSAPAGGIGLKGAAASANMTANNLANVTSSTFIGGMTSELSGITVSDIRWEFVGNAGINDSAKAADVYLNASTTVTIGTQSQFEPIGGANFLSNAALRFTVDTAGILTYISEVDTCFLVNATATVEKVGGGSDVLVARLAKNGTDILSTQSQTQSSDPTSVSCIGILELTKNDTVSLEVANNGSTSNIVVSTAALIVTGVK